MTAATVAALYAAYIEADRRYRRRPCASARQDAEAARAAYLAGRDWHRGRSLEEVSARAALVPTEYTDPLTVDLFPESRDAARLVPRLDRIAASLSLFDKE